MSFMLANNPASVVVLRRRVGWLCHLCRLLIVAYALWTLWLTISVWLDGQAAACRLGALVGGEVAPLDAATRLAAAGLSLLPWLVLCAACFFGWRLFTAFLEGEVLTAESASLLRRAALTGGAAVLLDIAVRPLIIVLATGNGPLTGTAWGYVLAPNDLALLIFLTSLIAVAHIFTVAAEIAEDSAAIL